MQRFKKRKRPKYVPPPSKPIPIPKKNKIEQQFIPVLLKDEPRNVNESKGKTVATNQRCPQCGNKNDGL